MNKTNIPWADLTWNPITGCTKGCEYCYARAISRRFGNQAHVPLGDCAHEAAKEMMAFPFGFDPTMYPHRLGEPLRLKKPSRIFIGSMGDLFDPAFPDEFRDSIFATVAATPQHTYLLLTKQPANMKRYFREGDRFTKVYPSNLNEYVHSIPANLWLGVTVTNQADADERIPLLLNTPAEHRWISVEPMIGPVRLNHVPVPYDAPNLDWVVCGAKTPGIELHRQVYVSGPKTTDVFTDDAPAKWLRSLRDQCAKAGVPFFYKHGGSIPLLDGVKHDAIGGAL